MTGGPVGTGGTEAGRIGVPLGFDVPAGWHAVDPASVGAAHAAFVLVRDSVPSGDFTPNITIGVDRREEPGEVAELADESVDRLSDAVARIDVIDRQTVGDDTAPAITQVLRMRTKPGPAGPGRELVQSQVHLVIPLDDAPDDRLIVELACTCLPTQTDAVIPDFQRLVASFHIREREGTQ
ncbi:MAG TPA: hypothetical protein VH352_28015 [Pseudonocardiaceae bacterium]|nr:hypothetical protein [Pseudonocardiaceae bacterium]